MSFKAAATAIDANRAALAVVFVLHLGATFAFFPPTEAVRSGPLYKTDYPVHTYRVHVYREALRDGGIPWGYDPALSAGAVMDPVHDVGAKPQQVLGSLTPFLEAGTVVRLFLFLVVLTFPLWVILACRRFGIDEKYHAWIAVTLVVPAWLHPQLEIWSSGIASFGTSAYLSVFVLALFLSYLESPTFRRYAALCLGATVLFLVHVLGPIVILPALAGYALLARGVNWYGRAALCAVPVVVLLINAFWAIPFLLVRQHSPLEAVEASWPPNAVSHMGYGEWSALIADFASPIALIPLLIGLGLAVYGLIILRKSGRTRVAVSLAVASGFGLFLVFFGSFLPVLVEMQPVRFLLPTFALMTIPVGIAVAATVERLRLPVAWSAVAAVFVVALGAVLLNRPVQLPLPPSPDPVAEFVASSTNPEDRLLIQSYDGYRYGGYHTKAYPIILGREVIGSNFPVIWDPPQFLRTMLLGRAIEAWRPRQLRESLDRWGIAWVFTVTPDAHELLEAALGAPGEELGDYRVFRVPDSGGRFMIGSGRLEAGINRMELSQLAGSDGLVVLRYRYHEGWRAESGLPVLRYAVPEDPSGFIALRNPPPSVSLRFDPAMMLRPLRSDASFVEHDLDRQVESTVETSLSADAER